MDSHFYAPQQQQPSTTARPPFPNPARSSLPTVAVPNISYSRNPDTYYPHPHPHPHPHPRSHPHSHSAHTSPPAVSPRLPQQLYNPKSATTRQPRLPDRQYPPERSPSPNNLYRQSVVDTTTHYVGNPPAATHHHLGRPGYPVAVTSSHRDPGSPRGHSGKDYDARYADEPSYTRPSVVYNGANLAVSPAETRSSAASLNAAAAAAAAAAATATMNAVAVFQDIPDYVNEIAERERLRGRFETQRDGGSSSAAGSVHSGSAGGDYRDSKRERERERDERRFAPAVHNSLFNNYDEFEDERKPRLSLPAPPGLGIIPAGRDRSRAPADRYRIEGPTEIIDDDEMAIVATTPADRSTLRSSEREGRRIGGVGGSSNDTARSRARSRTRERKGDREMAAARMRAGELKELEMRDRAEERDRDMREKERMAAIRREEEEEEEKARREKERAVRKAEKKAEAAAEEERRRREKEKEKEKERAEKAEKADRERKEKDRARQQQEAKNQAATKHLDDSPLPRNQNHQQQQQLAEKLSTLNLNPNTTTNNSNPITTPSHSTQGSPRSPMAALTPVDTPSTPATPTTPHSVTSPAPSPAPPPKKSVRVIAPTDSDANGLKSILKKTSQFASPSLVAEVTTAEEKEDLEETPVPEDVVGTRIHRRVLSPEVLMKRQVPFEVEGEWVVVLRAVGGGEVRYWAGLTDEVRAERYEKEAAKRERKRERDRERDYDEYRGDRRVKVHREKERERSRDPRRRLAY